MGIMTENNCQGKKNHKSKVTWFYAVGTYTLLAKREVKGRTDGVYVLQLFYKSLDQGLPWWPSG